MKLNGEAPVRFSGESLSLPVRVQWDGGNNNINKMHVIELKQSLLGLELEAKNGSFGCLKAGRERVPVGLSRQGRRGDAVRLGPQLLLSENKVLLSPKRDCAS
jgi:hypothetical protein